MTDIIGYYIFVLFICVIFLVAFYVYEYATKCVYKWVHESKSTINLSNDMEVYHAGTCNYYSPGLIYNGPFAKTVNVYVPKTRDFEYWEFNVYDSHMNLIHSVPMEESFTFGGYKYTLPSSYYLYLITSPSKSKKISGNNIWLWKHSESSDLDLKVKHSYDDTSLYEKLQETYTSIVDDVSAHKHTIVSKPYKPRPLSKYIHSEKIQTRLKRGDTVVVVTPKRHVPYQCIMKCYNDSDDSHSQEVLPGTTRGGIVGGTKIKKKGEDPSLVYYEYTATDDCSCVFLNHLYGLGDNKKVLPSYMGVLSERPTPVP